MKRMLLPCVLALIFTMLATAVSAKVQDVYFDGKTTITGSNKDRRIDFWIEISDTLNRRQPDFIASMVITAPDGTTWDIDPVADYLPLDKAYFFMADYNDFAQTPPPGTYHIPNGKYTLTVTDTEGKTVSAIDQIDGSYGTVPKIIAPLNDDVVGRTTMFRWKQLSEANFYRIRLYNETFGEPVYNGIRTQANTYMVPKGDLKPNCTYNLRIEAWNNRLDTDKRGRSEWVTFTTSDF